jgi:hypothetical protein
MLEWTATRGCCPSTGGSISAVVDTVTPSQSGSWIDGSARHDLANVETRRAVAR